MLLTIVVVISIWFSQVMFSGIELLLVVMANRMKERDKINLNNQFTFMFILYVQYNSR